VTTVEVGPSADCTGLVTVVVTVEADMARGPYTLEMYGTLIKGGSKTVGGGEGSQAFVYTFDRAPGSYSVGVTAHFADGASSSGTPVPFTVPGACEVTTTTSTIAATTTTSTVVDVPPTTVLLNEPPTFPTTVPATIAQTTVATVGSPVTLPRTGAGEVAGATAGGGLGLVVLGCVFLWIKRRW